MIRNPILTRFDLLSRLWRPEQHNLRSAFLRPDKLPQFVQDCPSAMRILDLLGTIPWDQFPERNLERSWGKTTIPHVAFSAACLLKLNENLVSIGELHRYLIEHPAFIWLLGFPLVPSAKHACGFDPLASLPTPRHLTQMLRDISNDALQFILEQSVILLMAEFSALGLLVGDCISLDTKHIIAWVKENNPKAYVSERFNKHKQPAGDLDCNIRATHAALRLLEVMQSLVVQIPEEADTKSEVDALPEIQVRIGLHCGSAVAGVVGEHKFLYDLWGDAVNTASRMESNGLPGKVHASAAFVEQVFLLDSHTKDSIRFIERGEMEIKGKGLMRTYFLEKK